MEMDWLSSWQTWAYIAVCLLAVPVFLTLREIVGQLKAVNRNLAQLREQLASDGRIESPAPPALK